MYLLDYKHEYKAVCHVGYTDNVLLNSLSNLYRMFHPRVGLSLWFIQ